MHGRRFDSAAASDEEMPTVNLIKPRWCGVTGESNNNVTTAGSQWPPIMVIIVLDSNNRFGVAKRLAS